MTHTHKCMRCGEEIYCLSPERCRAGENVLPRIMVIGPNGQPQLFEHVCGKLAAPQSAGVPTAHGSAAVTPDPVRLMSQCARHQGLPITITAMAHAAVFYCPHCEEEGRKQAQP